MAAFNLSIENGVAQLVFDLPGEKVNKLWIPQYEELEKILEDLAQRKDIKVLTITSGKEEIFIAGADLKKFEGAFKEKASLDAIIRTGHRVLKKLESLPFPTIAVIHGSCVGGGLELALACAYRIATDAPKTQLGLPETTLGLVPAWGGTYRLPHLVGLVEGLNLIASGKLIKAPQAYKIHLIDALIANEFREEKVSEFISTILNPEGRKSILERRRLKGLKHWILEANPLGRAFVFWKAERDILNKTKGHYPAPLKALEIIKKSYTLPKEQGLELEIQMAQQWNEKATLITKNLITLFFINDELKKDSGVPTGVKAQSIKSTGVLGAGFMGSAIAWLLTNQNFPVRMRDINLEVIGKGYGAVKSLYDQSVKNKRMKPSEANLKFQRLSGTVDLSGFNHVDYVIEAAVENLDLKNQLFAEIEKIIPEKAILATNTSSLSINLMAKNLNHPERFIGIHFFSPVNRMPLVEIIPGEKTSSETVATAVDFCKKLGKTPMIVGDCAGFLVNRILMMGANENVRLLEEGVPHEKIDRQMVAFGFPMPPFILADEVGNDVTYKVGKVLEEAYGERFKLPKLVQWMYENKLFGKKVGKGFYIWKGKSKTFNPQVLEMVAGKNDLSDEEISNRPLLLMINEAARCLEEGIIKRPDYLDMALIMGMGFPPFQGGLLRYADQIGIDRIVDDLQKLEQKQGSRFTPCNLLLDMKANHKKFHSE